MDQEQRPAARSRGPSSPTHFSRAHTELSATWRRERAKRNSKRRRAATDELKLFCLGYKQELARSFTLFNNAGVAFSLLSPLAALTGTYGTWGLLYGGPVVMMWGMPIVTVFSLLVAASLAECASAYPTSGAIYYWSWALAPARCKAVACWVSGWVLVLGQASFAAANCRIFTDLVAVFVLMGAGYQLSPVAQLAIFLVIFALSAAAASAPNWHMAFLTSLSTFWNLIALAALAVALPALAPARQDAGRIFTAWADSEAVTGVRSHVYNTLLGLLMSQYLYLGFDACAHVSEETHHADVNVPRGMLGAAGATALAGYAYLLALNAATTQPGHLLEPTAEARGTHAVAQLFWDVNKAAYGDGRGGLALLVVPLVASLMCCYQSVAANARMLYAFARDGAVPFRRYIASVCAETQAPLAAVWVMALLGACIGFPMYFSDHYVDTIETMAVVNTYLAYAVPILCRLVSRHGDFLPGPFNMGRLSRWVNGLSLLWVAFITVIFSLPTAYPVSGKRMNYNAAGTGLVVLGSLAAFYCPGVGGRHWFSGPRPNLGQFDDQTPLEALRKRRRDRAEAEAAAAEAQAAVAEAEAAAEAEAEAEAARRMGEPQAQYLTRRAQSQRIFRQAFAERGEDGGCQEQQPKAAGGSPHARVHARFWRQRHPHTESDPGGDGSV